MREVKLETWVPDLDSARHFLIQGALTGVQEAGLQVHGSDPTTHEKARVFVYPTVTATAPASFQSTCRRYSHLRGGHLN